MEAYPGKFAGLLAEGQDGVNTTLEHMRLTWAAWHDSASVACPQVLAWRKHSYMHWPVNYYIFSLCAAEHFLEVPQVAKELLEEVFLNVATKAVEDAFREQRESEGQAKGNNKILSPQAVWMTPVQRGVLSKLHRYEEVDHDSIQVSEGEPSVLQNRMYYPTRANLSVPTVKGIMSTKPAAHWPTFTPQSALAMVAEMVAMKAAAQNHASHQTCNVWLACLLDANMCIRRVHTQTWWLCLGTVRGTAGLAVPLHEVSVRGNAYFHIGDKPAVEWVVVLDEGKWEASMLTWLSPLHLLLRHKDAASDLLKSGRSCGCFAHGAMPLLQAAASNCFHSLGQAGIAQLAAHYGIPCEGSMFDMLWAMVKHALPHLSSDGILEVLSKRLQVEASYTPAFFSDPMVQEAFGEEDAKVLNEHIKVAKDKAVELKQFKESFTAKSKALR